MLGIEFSNEMIHWSRRFPDESPVIWRSDVQQDFDQGLSDTARAASGFVYRRTPHHLPPDQVAAIDRRFRARYEALDA